MPESKDLHIDKILSNLSIQYKQEEMIWRMLFPIVPVGLRSDKFWVYNKVDTFTLPDDTIGAKSLPNEYDWGVSTDNYSVKDHALGDWLAQEAIDNADPPISAEMDTNDFLNMLLETKQEDRVAAIAFLAATYPAGNKVQLAGATQWSGASDDPIKDVLDAVEGTFIRANTLVFGFESWKVFRRLPEILDAVKSSTRLQASPGGLATMSEVASLFDVGTLLVGRARKNTANLGQTAVFSRIWGKHMAALYVRGGTGVKTIRFGSTFVEQDRLTMRDFDPKRGVKGAHFFKVAWNSDEKVIASDMGYFVEDAVA